MTGSVPSKCSGAGAPENLAVFSLVFKFAELGRPLEDQQCGEGQEGVAFQGYVCWRDEGKGSGYRDLGILESSLLEFLTWGVSLSYKRSETVCSCR